MGKRCIVIISVFAILLAAAIARFFWQTAGSLEPVYEGKPLSYWLEGYNRSPGQSQAKTEPNRNQASEAVRNIGTNAIPFLLQMLQQRDSPLKDKFMQFARKKHFLKTPYVSTMDRNSRAQAAFMELSFRAKDATPQLIKIFDDNPCPCSRQEITTVFGYIQPTASDAVSFLLWAAANTNEVVRNNAIFALGKTHADPSRVVPVLIHSLQDTNVLVRAQATRALAAFDQDAQPAVPALLALLQKEQGTHTNASLFVGGPRGLLNTMVTTTGGLASLSALGRVDIVEMITKTLWHLDPDAAAKAGLQGKPARNQPFF